MRFFGGVAIIALAIFGVLTAASIPRPDAPMRANLRRLEIAFRPGDVLYLDRAGVSGWMAYQYEQYAPSVIDHLYAADSDEGPLAQPVSDPDDLPRCLWFTTAYWLEPEVQEHFHALESERPLQQMIGDDRYLFQRLCAPPLDSPLRFGEALRFWGADVETVEREQITVKLWWDVAEPPGEDYSIGLYLLNESGALVAQSDGPVQDFWGRGIFQTSQLEPGATYVDLRQMALPADLPAGNYTLAVAVYRPWDGTRLNVSGAASEDDVMRLEIVTLQ